MRYQGGKRPTTFPTTMLFPPPPPATYNPPSWRHVADRSTRMFRQFVILELHIPHPTLVELLLHVTARDLTHGNAASFFFCAFSASPISSITSPPWGRLCCRSSRAE